MKCKKQELSKESSLKEETFLSEKKKPGESPATW